MLDTIGMGIREKMMEFDPPIDTRTYKGPPLCGDPIEPSTHRKLFKIPTIVSVMFISTLVLYSMVSTLLWIFVLKMSSLDTVLRAIVKFG